MPGVGGGARRSVLGVLSRLRVKKFGPSTSGGLSGRSLAPFGLWPPPTPRAPPRMALLGAIWSCRRAQMGSMLPLEHGWVLWTSHGRGVPLKTPWWCQMLRYRRGLDGIRPASFTDKFAATWLLRAPAARVIMINTAQKESILRHHARNAPAVGSGFSPGPSSLGRRVPRPPQNGVIPTEEIAQALQYTHTSTHTYTYTCWLLVSTM